MSNGVRNISLPSSKEVSLLTGIHNANADSYSGGSQFEFREREIPYVPSVIRMSSDWKFNMPWGPKEPHWGSYSRHGVLSKISQLLRMEGVAWSAQLIPTAAFSLSNRSLYYFFQVAPQFYSRAWVVASGIEPGTSGSVTRNSDH
jgi:hypothetical protein